MADPLLTVDDLSVGYKTASGAIRAVDRVSLTLERGRILGLVGESGSGKSTLVMGLMRLLPPPGVLLGGRVTLDGVDLTRADEATLRSLYWTKMALVPQSALNALNPVLTIWGHAWDTLRAHGRNDRAAGRQRMARLLTMVGLDESVLDRYPHQLSGGMRQRVTLALALLLEPPLLVMDEPTTALDVVVEREILCQVLELQETLGFSVLFITHDVSLLLEIADEMGVLYGGRLVERGPVSAFAAGGRHPYTRGLLAAIPPAVDEDRQPGSIPGSPPSAADPPPGCRFAPRCPQVQPHCRQGRPPQISLADDHDATCFELSP